MEEYQDFEVRIRPRAADGAYPVDVRGSDGRRGEGSFTPPLTDGEVSEALGAMEQGLFDDSAIKELGARLFRALVTGEVKQIYDGIRRAGTPIRFRLILDAPTLARIPWELLYDPDGPGFVALHGALVRDASLAEPAHPLQVKPPLRVLVVHAFPQGVLKVEQEGESAGIGRALAGLIRRRQVRVEHLHHVSLQKLDDALREAADQQRRPYHVLHYIGHARHDPASGRTVLLFEDEQGRIDEVDPERLLEVIGRHKLRLVFLNACQSLQASGLDIVQGFAPELLRSGVPAVIGMQVSVLDTVAVRYARDFYDALADNRPVDAALTDARKPARGTRRRQADLAIPACYLRTATGRILELPERPALGLHPRSWWPWLHARATPAWAFNGVIVLIGLIASVIAIAEFVAPRFRETPPMDGDFNVAVARFGFSGGQGTPFDRQDADALSNTAHTFLDKEVGSLPFDSRARPEIEIRSPSLTGTIAAAGEDDQAEAAARLAEKIKADIVVYGVVVADQDRISFRPQFYISNSNRRFNDAEELLGPHDFGSITVEGDPSDFAFREKLRLQLLARTDALARFVIGLSLYADDQFERAGSFFAEAETGIDWGDRKQVLHLFQGSTAAQQGNLLAARAAYSRALAADPEYARGRLGAAEVITLMNWRAGCRPGIADPAVLEEAARGYTSALQAAHQPAVDLRPKVAYGLGRVYLCQSLAGTAERRADAEQQFRAVIAEYQRGTGRLKGLAAESHGFLGLLYLPVPDDPDPTPEYRRAADENQVAVALAAELNDHGLQALYHVRSAHIHIALGRCAEADQALAKADAAYGRTRRPDPEYEDFRQREQQNRQGCTPSAGQQRENRARQYRPEMRRGPKVVGHPGGLYPG
jgi:hypothetical protein